MGETRWVYGFSQRSRRTSSKDYAACQYHGFTAMLSFGSVNANISPVDLLLGYPANAILTWKTGKPGSEGIYPIVSYGTCWEVFLAPSY